MQTGDYHECLLRFKKHFLLEKNDLRPQFTTWSIILWTLSRILFNKIQISNRDRRVCVRVLFSFDDGKKEC